MSLLQAVLEALRGSHRDYTKGPIGTAVLLLAVPMVLEMFMESVLGMRKRVGILEQAGLVKTEKKGRVRTCKLGSCRLDSETAWIERYKEIWDRRFDALEIVVQELNQRKETNEKPNKRGTNVRA